MSQKEIILFGYHCSPLQRNSRNVSLASAAKTDYLLKVLKKLNYRITVLSTAQMKDVNFSSKETFETFEGINYIYPPQCKKNNILKKIINRAKYAIWLRKKTRLLFPKKIVLCYHSISLIDILLHTKKHNTFTLILEVEEIYSTLAKYDKYNKKENNFFLIADKLVTITENVNNLINRRNVPHINYYGPYDLFFKEKEKSSDNYTHVVYSGTVEKDKGGFLLSIEVFKKLNSDFVCHVLISQNDHESQKYANDIVAEANKHSRSKIIFHGTKYGEDFYKTISNFDIGLAIQNNDCNFSVGSFPSKTLTYLKCGLSTIVTYSKSFDNSPFSECFLFSYSNDIDDIIRLINKAKTNKINNTDFLNKLDQDFHENLKKFLGGSDEGLRI